MKNFWNEIKRPILCLAPMADVTDSAFRYIIAKYSKNFAYKNTSSSLSTHKSLLAFCSARPVGLRKARSEEYFCKQYITYTEFVSADGLVLAPEKGRQKLLKDLEYSEIERPIVAQIFGSRPENIEKAARLIFDLGFDGVDINMGCPDRNVEKQGAGAALIKNPTLAREIVEAAKRGASKNFQGETLEIPVSVKTRIGYHKDQLEEWLPKILETAPAAVVLHARTRKEMSKVPARWERIKMAVEIRDRMLPLEHNLRGLASLTEASTRKNSAEFYPCPENYFPEAGPLRERFSNHTLIIGNGDVLSVEDAYKKCEETGADGAMLGRAVFGNPWLFADYKPSVDERLKVLVEHCLLFEKNLGGVKSFAVMKKHFKSYLSGMVETSLKEKLMLTENANQVEELVKNFLSSKI